MTNNEKIARWTGLLSEKTSTGFVNYYILIGGYKHYQSGLPDYENSDAAAMTLLPVLVEKGYHPQVAWSNFHSMWEVHYHHTNFMDDCHGRDKSLSKAITTAILQLIESEAV